jgi:hypothetical protein
MTVAPSRRVARRLTALPGASDDPRPGLPVPPHGRAEAAGEKQRPVNPLSISRDWSDSSSSFKRLSALPIRSAASRAIFASPTRSICGTRWFSASISCRRCRTARFRSGSPLAFITTAILAPVLCGERLPSSPPGCGARPAGVSPSVPVAVEALACQPGPRPAARAAVNAQSPQGVIIEPRVAIATSQKAGEAMGSPSIG